MIVHSTKPGDHTLGEKRGLGTLRGDVSQAEISWFLSESALFNGEKTKGIFLQLLSFIQHYFFLVSPHLYMYDWRSEYRLTRFIHTQIADQCKIFQWLVTLNVNICVCIATNEKRELGHMLPRIQTYVCIAWLHCISISSIYTWNNCR